MPDPLVVVRHRTGVMYVRLNSPHNRNALSSAMIAQLRSALATASSDPTSKVVVIEGEGTVFCAGLDLREALTVGMEVATASLLQLMRDVAALPKPVIARVHGPVRAGGLGLMASADAVVCSQAVSFAFTEVALAVAPAAISFVIRDRAGSRQTSLAMLSGLSFSAAEALEMGLVSQVVTAAELDRAVDQLAADLGRGEPQGVAATKRLINSDLLVAIDSQGAEIAGRSAALFATEDARAAMSRLLGLA